MVVKIDSRVLTDRQQQQQQHTTVTTISNYCSSGSVIITIAIIANNSHHLRSSSIRIMMARERFWTETTKQELEKDNKVSSKIDKMQKSTKNGYFPQPQLVLFPTILSLRFPYFFVRFLLPTTLQNDRGERGGKSNQQPTTPEGSSRNAFIQAKEGFRRNIILWRTILWDLRVQRL